MHFLIFIHQLSHNLYPSFNFNENLYIMKQFQSCQVFSKTNFKIESKKEKFQSLESYNGNICILITKALD